MNDEQKGRGLTGNPQNQNYYGTFQGVVNYYPPFPQAPPQQVVGLPQPIPGTSNHPLLYGHGYQTIPGTFLIDKFGQKLLIPFNISTVIKHEYENECLC